MTYQGYVIARERLRHNWSQEGLCGGICTVSYLSKIESGKAVASEEILRLLMERLGLQYNAAVEAEARNIVEKGYECLFAFRLDRLQELLAENDSLRFQGTAAGLEWELLGRIANTAGPLEVALEACMDVRALALQRVLQNRSEEAVHLYPNAYTHLTVGFSAYEVGQYVKAIDAFQTAYELAAREGALRIMLFCKTFVGNCYCNQQDLGNMERCYRVARRMAENLDERSILKAIDYNWATIWIEVGRYEEAYRWFSSVDRPDAMFLHKLAICCEKTGRYEEGLAVLKKAEKADAGEVDPVLTKELLALVRYRLEHRDYLEQEAYGRLLLTCFRRCREELPSGYAVFHLPWMLEWYKATRQYKKACELLENFPGKAV